MVSGAPHHWGWYGTCWPVKVSDVCRSFVGALLVPNPRLRMGSRKCKGAVGVAEHLFFHDFPWRDMEARRVVAPLMPAMVRGRRGLPVSLVPADERTKAYQLPYALKEFESSIVWAGGRKAPSRSTAQESRAQPPTESH
ncbi:hypothetical protein AB1Y20_023380 [Prymnesium parvum]|uniref:Uncharacterized protein n=1 Tax=Prymnesium parvum TaxID=97485 RepID=A0AB34JDS8_PRYPA